MKCEYMECASRRTDGRQKNGLNRDTGRARGQVRDTWHEIHRRVAAKYMNVHAGHGRIPPINPAWAGHEAAARPLSPAGGSRACAWLSSTCKGVGMTPASSRGQRAAGGCSSRRSSEKGSSAVLSSIAHGHASGPIGERHGERRQWRFFAGGGGGNKLCDPLSDGSSPPPSEGAPHKA